ncbi:MAG: hypothetical protein KDE19_21220 [Caldilineaceae bacterium]|nr:hypothetical protein [Caldilineaceae bacterium]
MLKSTTLNKLFAPKSLTGKASLNAVASILDYATRVIVEFILNPLLVAGLGDAGFGLWRVLWRLNGYMMAAGGRSAQALKWAVAKEQASIDYHAKRQLVGSAVAVWLLFLPFLTLVGGLFTWLFPLYLTIPDGWIGLARITTALLVINSVLLSLTDIPRAVLQGENLGYARMGLSAGLVILGGVLTLLALYLDTGIVGVAAATLLTTLVTGIAFVRIARTHLPWFGLAWPVRRTVQWFLGLSGWFVVWKFVSQLMTSGDLLILGVFAQLELVTVYSLTKYVPEALLQLVAIGVFGAAPGLGGIIGQQQWQKAIRVRSEMMLYTWLLLTVAGATMLLWNQLFVDLWVGPAYDAGIIATLLIILMMAQYTLIRNDANVIDLTLDVQRKVLLGLLAVILSMGLAALLVGWFDMGITGLCLGLIVGRLLLSWRYPQIVGQILGLSMAVQLRAIVRPLLASTLLFAAALFLQHELEFASWVSLLIGSGMTVLVATPVAAIIGLTGAQRAQLLNRVWKTVGR